MNWLYITITSSTDSIWLSSRYIFLCASSHSVLNTYHRFKSSVFKDSISTWTIASIFYLNSYSKSSIIHLLSCWTTLSREVSTVGVSFEFSWEVYSIASPRSIELFMFLFATILGLDLAYIHFTNSLAPALNSGFKDSKFSYSMCANHDSSDIGLINVRQSLSMKYFVIASRILFFL